MILEITCELRERRVRLPRTETFTTAARSADPAEVNRLIAERFPGVWCVKPEVRIVSATVPVWAEPPHALDAQNWMQGRGGYVIDSLELPNGKTTVVDTATEQSTGPTKRKPGRQRKHG